MKRYTKHSPDFIEAMLMRRIFDIKKTYKNQED